MTRLRKRHRVHLYRYTGRTCAVAGLTFAVIPVTASIAAGDLPAWHWAAIYIGSWTACWFGIRQARSAAITAAARRELRRQLDLAYRLIDAELQALKRDLNIEHLSDDEALQYLEEIDLRYNE
jgi:hypothetical protein